MARNSAIHFRLKPRDNQGKCIIYLQFVYDRQRLFYSLGQRVEPKNWNVAKQRVKNSKITTADGQYSLNELLDSLEAVLTKAYNDELKNGIPSPETLKDHLKAFFNKNKPDQDGSSLYRLIQRFIDGEIKYKGREKTVNTIKKYKTALSHLKQFEKEEKYRVDFDTITLDFFYKYSSFLRKTLSLAQNSILKDIKIIKLFMGEGVDLGQTNNLQYKHKKFTLTEAETDAVFLNEKEIIALYNYDLSDNKKLEQQRDLFVFGCFIGLRFSDYSNIKPENIVKIDEEFYIKIITKKTNELVIIPCNPIVVEIFDKYSDNPNHLPRSISNQKFNEYIKSVCKLAGLAEKGRLSTDPGKELWECISSHTARRSMATNYYLEGFPTIDLMKITGHKTEKAFLKYIRVTKLDTAKRLNEHIKKSWSAKLLKVAS